VHFIDRWSAVPFLGFEQSLKARLGFALGRGVAASGMGDDLSLSLSDLFSQPRSCFSKRQQVVIIIFGSLHKFVDKITDRFMRGTGYFVSVHSSSNGWISQQLKFKQLVQAICTSG
jgi:hypothetical protein